MASNSIPVILRVMAERDPGLADTLQQIERALAEMSRRAEQAGASAGGIDQGLEDAAQAARKVATSASRAAASVRKVADAEDNAATEADELAAAASRAETGLKGAERASGGLLAGLQKIGQQSALDAAMQALPTGSVGKGLPAAPVTAQEQQKRAVEVLNQALEETEKQYDKTAKKAVDLGQKSGMAMMAAGAGVAALLGYAVQVAGQFEQLRAKLETVQKSAIKAGETFEFARELAAKTPFDVQGVVSAAVQLEVYGTRAQEVLPLVADLAAGMGKRIEDTSLVVGKAVSGSLEGWESLRNEYGISNAKLAQYGATLTATGGIAASTAGDLEKAKAALQRIIQTEFGGAVERQSRTLQGALSNAGDSVQNLAATYGEALVPLVTGAASAFSGLVDAATSVPAPLKAVAVGVAAAGAGLLVMAGGTTIAVAGLVALNSQLLAAGPNIAAAGVAARVTSGALGMLGTAARGAGSAMAFLATNPFGLALTATVVGVGLATMALSSYEESQRKTGEALAEESRALQTAAQRWRTYRDAIQEASGESLEFGANVREIAATLDGLRDNPSALVAKFQERGFKLQDLQKDLESSRSEADNLRESIQRILVALAELNRRDGQPRRSLRSQLIDMFPEKGMLDDVTLDDVQQKLAGLRSEFQQVAGTGDILSRAIEWWKRLEDPLSQAANEAARLNGYLKFAGKADDVRTMTEALAETERTLKRLQSEAGRLDPKLPVNDQGALQRRLLDPSLTDGQRDAIEGILTLMGEVESQAERINQANEKAHSERIRLMDQEFARSQAGRDQDLNATIAHLERKLQAVRGNAEQETQVLNQLHQARKQQRQEEIQSQRTALQKAIRAATEQTERLASSGEGTAAQVAEGYRGVLVILDDWARAHKVLLDQVPELREEYDRLRKGAEDQVASSERTARAEKLSTLREQAREIQAGARGQQEQLQATRDSLDLYERVLRSSQDLRNDAQSRKALQSEINDLRRREVDLVEQLAERERQSKQQTAGLSQQLLDAEIATLEARLRAGEDVESELQAKRAERYRAALEMIQAETDAEVQAAEGNQVLIEEALKRGLTRRRLLQEQERQRLLSGLRQEVSAVEDAEAQKDRARKRFRPEDRIGGENSPLMTGEEAFADVLPGMKGLQLGNTPSILGGKKAEDNTRQQAEDELKTLGEAAQQTGKSLSELPPVQTEFGAAATAGGVSLRELAAAASQAAASLSSIAGGGAGAGGGGEDLPPAPEGTTTDGRYSYAPGYGPKDAKPVADGGYPTTGYPGLERRMPTPVEMGAVSPRVVTQAPVRTSSMSRSEVRQTVIVNGAASTEPQAQAVAREAARLVEQQQDRKRLMAGPWR